MANTGKIITIARDVREILKATAYATFKTVWRSMGLPMKHFNKNMSEIQYNGNLIRFVGVNDNPDRALGMEQDILWGNEWINANKEASDHMEQRTSYCCIFDYNPSEVKHWLYDLENSPHWRMLKTTLLDNPYVPEKHKRKILSYEPTPENIANGTADKYMWAVYGQGKRAIGETSVFKKLGSYKDDPLSYDWRHYGGDFGYTNDPTALVRGIKVGNKLYLRELMYETGLLNPDIAKKVTENGWNDEYSVWDSADGCKSVDELRRLGVPAYGAEKPAGSVYFLIEKLKQFEIFIHEDSHNLREEFESYKWAIDKHKNYKRNSLKQLVPENGQRDHLIDSTRYLVSLYEDMTGLNKIAA